MLGQRCALFFCTSTAGQQVINANSNSNSNIHDFGSVILKHLYLLGVGLAALSGTASEATTTHKVTTGVTCCHKHLLHLVRNENFCYFSIQQYLAVVSPHDDSAQSVEITMSPIQRLMHNLFPDGFLAQKDHLVLESLSGFLTVSMWQRHLCVRAVESRLNVWRIQNEEESDCLFSSMVHFPRKISAVPCKDGCPPVTFSRM